MTEENLPQKKFSPETFEKFIEMQAQEMENKRSELAIHSKSVQNQHEYAMAALSAQADAHKTNQSAKTGQQKSTQNFIILALTLILIFLGASLLLDKESVALEIIKIFGTALISGGGGYGIGLYKGNKNQKDQ